MLSQYIQVKFSHIQSSILIPIFKKEKSCLLKDFISSKDLASIATYLYEIFLFDKKRQLKGILLDI